MMSPYLEEQRKQAIAWLGKRWVLHPSRRVPKGNYEPNVMRCNVAETIAKARRKIDREKESDKRANE